MEKTSRHGLLVALLVGVILLVLALLALFAFYPIFGMTLITACYVIWCYLFTENHRVHRAQVSAAYCDTQCAVQALCCSCACNGVVHRR
jgi:Ca2+/Na+ antiporter